MSYSILLAVGVRPTNNNNNISRSSGRHQHHGWNRPSPPGSGNTLSAATASQSFLSASHCFAPSSLIAAVGHIKQLSHATCACVSSFSRCCVALCCLVLRILSTSASQRSSASRFTGHVASLSSPGKRRRRRRRRRRLCAVILQTHSLRTVIATENVRLQVLRVRSEYPPSSSFPLRASERELARAAVR